MNEAEARNVVVEVLAAIAPEIDGATIDPDAELGAEVDLDSMDFLNLVDGVSARVGHDIPEHDYPHLTTLAAFGAYLAKITD